MLYSMTGFGKSVAELSDKKILIEIKSLNSKQLDFFAKIPHFYKEIEIDLRKIVSKNLRRGKIELHFFIENTKNNTNLDICESKLKNYFFKLKKIAEELDIKVSEELFNNVIKLPEVLVSKKNSLSDEEKNNIFLSFKKAIDELNSFRKQEGNALLEDISTHIEKIIFFLNEIPQHEENRIQIIKNRINNNLKEISNVVKIDRERFEQELIYYLEKFDISEEKIRLKNHCKYFKEIIFEDENIEKGKKLSFISQEIGREINTIGSKANEINIQKIVILMKNELEKIKEQLMNVL